MSQDMLDAYGRMSAIQQQFNEINWAELEADDQVNAMITRQKLNDAYAQAQANYSQIEQQSKQQAEAQRQQLVANSRQQLLKALPSWADESVAKKEIEQVRAAGISMGYTEDDINGITDYRAFLTLRKAMLYDQLMSEKASAVKQATKAPKVLKVTGRKVAKADNVDALIQRAKESGKQQDQTAALRGLFSG